MPAYEPDRSLAGKLRRRMVRLQERRMASFTFERPVVSFTFDDIPTSAAETGARLLEKAGVRGTFYVSTGLAGRDGPMGVYADETAIYRLAAAGHEIGCHTRDHLDVAQVPLRALEADIEANRRALAGWARRPASFAYPYGEVAQGPKRVLARHFSSLRALHPGVVTGETDLNQLPCVGIEGVHGEATARLWIDKAVAATGWTLLYTHDVRAEASAWGCTPDALERLIDHTLKAGCEIATVETVVSRATPRSATARAA